MATRRTSPTAIPAIPPATPLKEFKSDIVIGISAPPTRIANAIPKNAESMDMSHIHSGQITATTTVAIMVSATISECAFQTTGF